MSARPHVSAVPNTPIDDIAFINFRTRGCPIRIVESEAETLRDHLFAVVRATASTVRAVSLAMITDAGLNEHERPAALAGCEIIAWFAQAIDERIHEIEEREGA